MLPSLTAYGNRTPAFRAEMERLRTEDTRAEPVIFPRVCAAAYSFLVALVAEQQQESHRLWAVADALPTQERLAAELPLWGITPIFVPEKEEHINNGLSDPDLAAERLNALRNICTPAGGQGPHVIVVTKAGLSQQAPHFSPTQDTAVTLAVGTEIAPEHLARQLTEHGFERTDQVISRGQWSLRGGILDVYPLQSAWPLRLEFFGDELESIRAFDVDSQLSFRKLERADLVLEEPPADRILRDLISPQDWIVSLPGCAEPGNVLLFDSPPEVADVAQAAEELNAKDPLTFYGSPLGSFETGDFVMQEARRALARQSLQRWKADKWRIVMYFPHAGEKQRFEEICGDDDAWSAVQSRDGDLPFGFTAPGAKLAVLSAAEIFGRYSVPHAKHAADREERMRRERAQAPLREILPGDYVVHAAHGLGKFISIVQDDKTGEEELHILYAGDVLLRIPLSQGHLVSKYVGLGAKRPELFQKTKHFSSQ